MDTRLKATRYIWTAFPLSILFIMAGTIATDTSIGAGHVVMVAICAIACMIPTIVMWEKGSSSQFINEEQTARKSKRRGGIDRLVDKLNDDERAALLDRLQDETEELRYSLSDDGELVHMRR